MSIFAQAIEGAAYAGANFRAANHLTGHEKDGHQHFAVGMLAWERLSFLTTQLKKTFPNFQAHGIAPLFIGVGAVLQVTIRGAESYLAKKGEKNWALEQLCQKTVALGKLQTTYSNDLVTAACCVSYVAMIACGWVATGVTGFLGVFLIVLKRKGEMSSALENYLKPLCLIAGIAADLLTPLPNIYRALAIYNYSKQFTNLIIKHNATNKYLPSSISKPSAGKHQKVEAWPSGHFAEETAKKFARSDDNFEVNRTHIYSEDIQILPKDFREEVANKSAEELFKAVEKRVEAINANRNEDEKITLDSGWEILKKEVVDGKFQDKIVPNLDELRVLMKAQLLSLLNNENESQFKEYVEELESIGNGCTAADTRSVKNMLQPKTEDPIWAVHYTLMQERDTIVSDLLAQADENVRKRTKGFVSANLMGGLGDVHLKNMTQKSLWHRARPYSAEISYAQQGRSLSETILLNGFNRLQGSPKLRGVCEAALLSDHLLEGFEHPESAPLLVGLFYEAVYKKGFDERYNVETIVNTVHQAIKLGLSGAQYTAEGKEIPSIHPSVVNKWIQSFQESASVDYISDDFNNWHEDVQFVDHAGKVVTRHIPTKDAVRLLLEHAGILTRKKR